MLGEGKYFAVIVAMVVEATGDRQWSLEVHGARIAIWYCIVVACWHEHEKSNIGY